MNILDTIITVANRADRSFIQQKIPELSAHSKQLTNELKKYLKKSLEGELLEFKLRGLSQRADEHNASVESIINMFEKNVEPRLQEDREDLLKMIEELQEAQHCVAIYRKMTDFLLESEDCKLKQDSKRFVEAYKSLGKLRQTLQSIPDGKEIEIVKTLGLYVSELDQQLQYSISLLWDDHVKFSKDEGTPETVLTLKILKSEDIPEILQILCQTGQINKFKLLSSFLIEGILAAVIRKPVIIEESSKENDGFDSLIVRSAASGLPTHKDVFQKTIEVFKFLNKTINYEMNDGDSFLNYLGNVYRERFTELLIIHCLDKTVPKKVAELQLYSKIEAEIVDFQTQLVQLGFYNESFSSILDFARNIDVTFIDKMCEEFRKRAESVMARDLHDSVETKTVSGNNGPNYQISKSIIEILKILKEMFELTKTSSELCVGRVLCTIQNIIDIYPDMVRDHHQKLLGSIPQQAALFYNNCEFLADETEKLMKQFLSELKKFENSTGSSHFYVNLGKLQSAGRRILNDTRDGVLKQMKQSINDSALSSLGISDKMDQTMVEKTIKQCVRQAELLKLVWGNVLPPEIYEEVLGFILNTFIGYVIEVITAAEDISTFNAEVLKNACLIILERSPGVFLEPDMVFFRIKNWYKLKELAGLMTKNLKEIDDRWADGHGPLAVEFRPVEMKSLIRAFFQNTDQRAALLAKIQ